MNDRIRSLLLCALIAAPAWLTAPTAAHAQWDDNCLRECALDLFACLGASGCTYQGCASGETCRGGRCYDADGRQSGSCGVRPTGCDRGCFVTRSICVSGCLRLFADVRRAVPEIDPFGPLRERLSAAEEAAAKAIDGVAPAAAQHLEEARAEVAKLLAEQKIDPGHAVALQVGLDRVAAALQGDGLRRCAAGLADPNGSAGVELWAPPVELRPKPEGSAPAP